jgi:preprotein translocase subunit SecF
MNLFKHYFIYFIISAVFLIPGCFYLFNFGLNPAIDFTGGTLLEIKFNQASSEADLIGNATASAFIEKDNKEINLDEIKNIALGENFEVETIQKTDNDQFILRGKEIDNKTKLNFFNKLSSEIKPVQELRFETVGPILGKELIQKTVVAVILASLVIIIYLVFQFHDLSFGICAILAMIHDILILLGIFSILGVVFGVEVDILFVTAVLTALSFSVRDTVVIYDRLRELKTKEVGTTKQLASKATMQTMVRSINNSLTTIFMLLALFLLGGSTIKWFVLALLIGVITGTYSSPFTSIPLLLLWEDWKKKRSKK